MDIYRPAQAARAPVLVVVHGGAWMMGDKANGRVVDHKVAHWLPQGWTLVSVNYRMLPWADPRVQAADLARAVAAVQSTIAAPSGTGDEVFLMGHSTGAHLGALVLADPALGAPFGLRPLRGAVLLDSAALDVVQLMTQEHLPLHDRAFGSDALFWRAASPWHCLSAATPPMLLVPSAQRPDSVSQSRHFAARTNELGGAAQVWPAPLGHGEINEQVGQAGELTSAIDTFFGSLLNRAAP
jgi:acetyl esterase/lipase